MELASSRHIIPSTSCFQRCPHIQTSRARPARAAALAQPGLVKYGALWRPCIQQRARSSYRLHVAQLSSAAAAPEHPSEADLETVVLDVSSMKCGGCSASVKRILSAQSGVEGVAVNLLTESAVFRIPAGKDAGAAGAEAAELLTKKGFPSKVRSLEEGLLGDADAAAARREAELKRSLLDLGIAWGLALICCSHHIGHVLHGLGMHSVAHTPFMHSLGSPAVSAALGAFALLGPGRKLLVDGALSLYRGNPNMNSLIGLGAATSFAAGAASTLIPGMGLEVSFLEEPVMLLAVVLLGRTLEARARLKASADLHTLAKLIPEKSRLVLDPGSPPGQQGAVSGAGVELVQVPTASIRAGDVIRVLPGERIPVDGQILEGRCSVDESMLTGESALVPKASGAKVTAGTVNYEGPITLRATSTGSDSTLAGIGRLVADAQAREAPVQRLADAVAGKFCYGVMAASAATFGFWAAAGANLFPQALHAIAVSGPNAPVLLGLKLAVDVLVVACPCALGLATPTAVLVASSVGAKRGLLLRGGDVLERIASVNVVVFDKTGTLTQGRMQLVGSQLLSGRLSESEVLRLAAGVEASTRHPLADALLKAAKAQGVQVPHTEGASTEPGQGVSASVDGRQVAVGKLDWVRQQTQRRASHASSSSSNSTGGRGSSPGSSFSGHGAESASSPGSSFSGHGAESASSDGSSSSGSGSHASFSGPGAESASSDGSSGSGIGSHPGHEPGPAGQTVVYVGAEGDGVIGAYRFSDTLRGETPEVVAQLRGMGLRVMMLSGDNQAAVNAIAGQAGIAGDSAWGEMRPEQKAAVIQQLRQAGNKVAMVGDGVNDAPALAAADVGIALSGGMDAAGEAASVVLMGDRLGQVVEAITLGRSTLGKIKQNLAWALVYNVIGIPLAAGALLPTLGIALNPSAAGAMMAFSSLAVVSNSLLLRAQFGSSSPVHEDKLPSSQGLPDGQLAGKRSAAA